MRRMTVLALLAGACSGKDTTPETTDPNPVTANFGDDESGDTGGTPPLEDLTGLVGSLALVHLNGDLYNEESYFGYGLFMDGDGGMDNIAGCYFYGGGCVAEYPQAGDPAVETGFFPIYVNEIHEVGIVEVGDWTLVPYDSVGFPLYVGDNTTLGGPGGLTLDGDYAPYAGTDDLAVPDEMAVTAPDPTVAIAAVPGGVIDLAWASPGEGGVYLEVISSGTPLTPDTIVRLDDDGSHQIQIDDLQFRQPFETKYLLLSRIETRAVDAAGNTIQVQARSDQWFYVDFTDTTGWTELPAGTALGETCADALLLPSVGSGQYYGDLSTFAHDHDLGDYNPLTNYGTTGLDGVVPVTMLAGQTLTATYLQAYDASIYVLGADCDTDTALAGADTTLDGEEEELVFTAAADGTYYVVLDAWTSDAGADFTLVMDIQ